MTEKDKSEIAAIVRAVMEEHGHCALGIKSETAHELISFADTWKHTRRTLIGGVIIVAVGGMLAAMWLGIKIMVKQ